MGEVVFLKDITLRKQSEEQLKKYSESLEEMVAERTKELHETQEEMVRKEKLAILGRLAGGVGHETHPFSAELLLVEVLPEPQAAPVVHPGVALLGVHAERSRREELGRLVLSLPVENRSHRGDHIAARGKSPLHQHAGNPLGVTGRNSDEAYKNLSFTLVATHRTGLPGQSLLRHRPS